MDEMLEINPRSKKDGLGFAFFWLSGFYLVYCLRPEDWIPGVRYLHIAKITGILAILGLIRVWGRRGADSKICPAKRITC
jgi:hypothetical protein